MIELIVGALIFYIGFKLGSWIYRKNTVEVEEHAKDALEKYHDTFAELEYLKRENIELTNRLNAD
jgi:cell shape-determining protein MreC